jgi:hypothetical protein
MASVLAECSHEAKQFFVLLALAALQGVDHAIFEQEQSETVEETMQVMKWSGLEKEREAPLVR